jgi:SAM-dependent methyltransferase
MAASVGERDGWDFSRVRDEREPVPWDYAAVVRRYVKPSSQVLDVGTGGGERFLELAPYFGAGVGVDVDPSMIRTAYANRGPRQRKRIGFQIADAGATALADRRFDVVLNRHAIIDVTEVLRVLRPGGCFITQQPGPRNTANICAAFGCDPGGMYTSDAAQEISSVIASFQKRACRIVCEAEYDVRYWFKDVPSLIFWHKAIPIPEDFDIQKHWKQVAQIVDRYSGPKGIETNEHRLLLIVQKP